MSEENIFEFPAAEPGEDGVENIPSIATFTQKSPANSESSNEDRSEGPGYYVDTTVSSSSSSNDGIDGTTESIPSTPTEVIQHPAQPQDIQQQQHLSATLAFQAAAAQQAAQLAANAAALQAAHAQQAMAEATSQSTEENIAMSLHQTMPSVSMPMSCMANGVIASSTAHVTSVAAPMQVNPAFSDGNVAMGGGVMPVPMMMHQVQMDQSQQGIIHHGKGNKNMPPTPPASADEKDPNDPDKKKILINMIPPPNVTAAPPGGPGPVPVSLMQLNGQNMQPGMPGGHTPGQHMHQYGPTGHMPDDRIPMPAEAHAMYNPIPLPDEELSPGSSEYSGARSPRGNSNKRRNNKKPVPVEDKDDKYFERRKRNNLAAKRSRDARKHREDTIAMRANYLERENAILRAQLATLREEANSLRQLLSQRTMIGPNGQQMNTMQ